MCSCPTPPSPLSAPFPRLSQEVLSFRGELDILKFLCKDIWMALFQKQMDSLRTNHQVGVQAGGAGRLSRAGPGPRVGA